MPPPMLTRLTSQLEAKGMPTGKARAVATSQLQKSGNLKKGSTEQTTKGDKRQAMGAAGRAKDRASKESGHKPGEYAYNPRTNRATLKMGMTKGSK